MTFIVHVNYPDGTPAIGAKIEFAFGDEHAGSVISRAGGASISIPDGIDKVTLSASVGTSNTTKTVSVENGHYTLVVDHQESPRNESEETTTRDGARQTQVENRIFLVGVGGAASALIVLIFLIDLAVRSGKEVPVGSRMLVAALLGLCVGVAGAAYRSHIAVHGEISSGPVNVLRFAAQGFIGTFIVIVLVVMAGWELTDPVGDEVSSTTTANQVVAGIQDEIGLLRSAFVDADDDEHDRLKVAREAPPLARRMLAVHDTELSPIRRVLKYQYAGTVLMYAATAVSDVHQKREFALQSIDALTRSLALIRTTSWDHSSHAFLNDDNTSNRSYLNLAIADAVMLSLGSEEHSAKVIEAVRQVDSAYLDDNPPCRDPYLRSALCRSAPALCGHERPLMCEPLEQATTSQ